jgi:hypothetical protein
MEPSDTPPQLRLVRDELASYVRPLPRDFGHLARLLATGTAIGKGIIVDPRDLARSEDLRKTVRARRLELILDPLSVELSFANGHSRRGAAELPWADARPDVPERMTPPRLQAYAEALASVVVETGATTVLAPTHVLEGVPSRWLGTDHDLTRALRTALNQAGRKDVRIYYPLITRLSVVESGRRRDHLIARLRGLVEGAVVDAVWIRICGFGVQQSGPVNLRRYFALARALHDLGVPIVAERTGVLGLALLAFGAVGGIEQGITMGDRYDLRSLTSKRRGSGGFLPSPRVYIHEVGLLLPRDRAQVLLSHRTLKHRFVCQRECCPRGLEDMIRDPRKHFLCSRHGEVLALSQIPPADRADRYLEDWLRPASDRAVMAARIDDRLSAHRERLDQWRTTLSDLRSADRVERPSVSPIPTGFRVQRRGA